jgi:hypothetical protein
MYAGKKTSPEINPGFSEGEPNAKVSLYCKLISSVNRVWIRDFQDENDVAEQLVGFMQQFFQIFSELNGKKLYLTGESVRIASI